MCFINYYSVFLQFGHILQFLVHAAAWLFPEFRYVWLAEETKRNLPVELDFLNEGRNSEKVAKILSKFKFLKVSFTHSFKNILKKIINRTVGTEILV